MAAWLKTKTFAQEVMIAIGALSTARLEGYVFPRSETLIPLILRFMRYSLVDFWVTAGAPWLFFHFKLANYPKM